MGLVHVNGLLHVSAEGSDENLVDLVFHNGVREPPALGALDAVTTSSDIKKVDCLLIEYTHLVPLVFDARRRDCVTLAGDMAAAT